MKLLFLANARIPTERAMGTAIMKQCEAFSRAGVTVELVVPKRHNVITGDPYQFHGVEPNFTIRYLRSLDCPSLEKFKLRSLLERVTFFMSLSFYLLKSDADVLYTREPDLIGPLRTKKKKYVELHHLYGLRFFGRRYLSACAGIITITHALKADVVRAYAIKPSRMQVAPSGVDINAFREEVSKESIRAKLGIMSHKPVAMYIGALEAWKGYEIFLKAATVLEDTVHSVVVGGDAQHVSELRLKYPQVQFLGMLPQRDLPRNQQAANVLVVPNSGKEEISARHTSPLKVFAHMASGIPIVASSIDSIREILSERNAILVIPDDPEALARGVEKALKEESLVREITRQAKKDVSQYDWNERTKGILRFIKGGEVDES